MVNEIYALVRDCSSCELMRGKITRHAKKLSLFPAKGPLELVAMNLLWPIPKKRCGNVLILVIKDHYLKLTRTVPLPVTTGAMCANAFLSFWVFAYGMQDYLLTNKGSQLFSEFFESICKALGITYVTTKKYHPQTNGQTERYNRTLVA